MRQKPTQVIRNMHASHNKYSSPPTRSAAVAAASSIRATSNHAKNFGKPASTGSAPRAENNASGAREVRPILVWRPTLSNLLMLCRAQKQALAPPSLGAATAPRTDVVLSPPVVSNPRESSRDPNHRTTQTYTYLFAQGFPKRKRSGLSEQIERSLKARADRAETDAVRFF